MIGKWPLAKIPLASLPGDAASQSALGQIAHYYRQRRRMVAYLKQSTAVSVKLGPFVDSTDGVTPMTSLTISQSDVRLAKNDANWGQKSASGNASHEESGWYEVSLSTTDTNTLGRLVVAVNESGALPVWCEFQVVPANVYDSLVAGSDTLQADVTQFGGSNGTFSGGRAEVNASHWGGTAVASANVLIDGAITAAKIASNAITDAKIASGALTAAKFASGAFDAVWSVATRVLTAGTNIVLAKGTGVTGLNDLDAGDIRTAVGLATANLDTQLGTIDANVDAVLEDTGTTIPGALTSLGEMVGDVGSAVDDLNDLSEADVRSAVGLASADLDTQLSGIDGKIDTVDGVVDAIKAKTDALTFSETGHVDANIKRVADVTVAGTGQPGSEWGPA